MEINRVNIYDMDGTIVDSSHRYRTLPCNTRIDLPYWIENEYLGYKDKLLPLAKQYQEDLKNENTYVIIATSRVLSSTCYWFIQNILGIPDYIISREGRNDTRKAHTLKTDGISDHLFIKGLFRKEKHFYEDNLQVCKSVSKAIGATGHYIPSQQGH